MESFKNIKIYFFLSKIKTNFYNIAEFGLEVHFVPGTESMILVDVLKIVFCKIN